MGSFRHRLQAIAIATAGAQVLVLALALATVCGSVEHTHGGQPAPDCPMHHQQGAPTPTAHHHHHHGNSEPSSDGPRITCGCPGDILAAILGQTGVITASIDVSPSTDGITVQSANPQSVIDVVPGPLAPPPRA